MMLDTAFFRLLSLRSAPHEQPRLDDFLTAVEPVLRARIGRGAGDEILQDCLIRVWRSWSTCRATVPAELGGWLRQIARRCRIDRGRVYPAEDLDPDREASDDHPDEDCRRRALALAIDDAIDAARHLDPETLSRAEQSAARAARIGSTAEVSRRNVELAILTRVDRMPSDEAGAVHGMTGMAARAASARGASAISLAARILLRNTHDLFLCDALEQLAGAA
jgi:DNA-directed RNA polymerase specialized sigma24 family protein